MDTNTYYYVIKNKRLQMGWSQDYTAQKAGISKSTYIRVENGDNVEIYNILSILNILGLKMIIEG